MQNKHSNETKTFRFKLIELKKIKFFENDPKEIGFSSNFLSDVKTKIDTMIGIDKDKKTINIILDIILYQDSDTQIELFGIKTKTSYKIDKFSDIIGNKKVVNLPNQFLNTLISIAYSSSRGMLAVLITNEEYKSIILPIIDPLKLLPNKKQITNSEE